MDDHLDPVAGAEDVLAQKAGLVRLGDGALEDVGDSAYSPRMNTNPQPAPAASAAIAIPSISWCGFFCISSRSLNAPGSDSSALQHRYFDISPRGRNDAFFPIEKPAPPRPRRPDSSSTPSSSSGSRMARSSER